MGAAGAQVFVIINWAAGRARRGWPSIERALRESAIHFEAHETRHAGDATVATRRALLDGYETVVVVGGDGTLSEAASGFFHTNGNDEGRAFRHQSDSAFARTHDTPLPINARAALALLPAGTGDDFARGLKGRREPLDVWLRALIAHCRAGGGGRMTRTIDVMWGSAHAVASGQAAGHVHTASAGARPFICLNVATLGLGAEVARRVGAQGRFVRRWPGEARFVAASCAALAAWRERLVRVTADGEVAFECSSNLLAVANGIYAGGGMMFAPGARVDDGALDFLAACGIGRATILREMPRIRRGEHLTNPRVRTLRCRRVRVETLRGSRPLLVEADGNLRGHTPAEFRVLPAALRVVV